MDTNGEGEVMGTQRTAELRVCASCEWIFKNTTGEPKECPKCDWPTYGARYVYGDKCYKYAETQEPWLEKKMDKYERKLLREIRETNG